MDRSRLTETKRFTEHGDAFIDGCSDRGSIPLASTSFILNEVTPKKSAAKTMPLKTRGAHLVRFAVLLWIYQPATAYTGLVPNPPRSIA